jgi:hypothetical protein
MCITRKGFAGLFPGCCKAGDLVHILLGCTVPVILRQINLGRKDFQLVGDVFMLDMMRGDATKTTGFFAEDVVLY